MGVHYSVVHTLAHVQAYCVVLWLFFEWCFILVYVCDVVVNHCTRICVILFVVLCLGIVEYDVHLLD